MVLQACFPSTLFRIEILSDTENYVDKNLSIEKKSVKFYFNFKIFFFFQIENFKKNVEVCNFFQTVFCFFREKHTWSK